MTSCDSCRTPIPDATVEAVLVSPAGIYCPDCWKAAYLGDGWVENPTRDEGDDTRQGTFL